LIRWQLHKIFTTIEARVDFASFLTNPSRQRSQPLAFYLSAKSKNELFIESINSENTGMKKGFSASGRDKCRSLNRLFVTIVKNRCPT